MVDEGHRPSRDPLSGESRFRTLVDAIGDYAIYMLDSAGRVISWNPGAERMKGYTESEILGRHFGSFLTEEDQRQDKPRRVLHVARTTGRYEEEAWRVRKDGSRFWAFAVIHAVYDDAGEFIGFANITRDMTERRTVQQALRQSEQRFRLLVDGVVDYAIYMLDPEGWITNWNAGAERIKGYSQREAIGLHFSRFFTEADRQAGVPWRALESAAREGKFESEGWRVRKDGRAFWAHAVLDAVRDEQGHLIGFAKITRDMTEQRQAQADLERVREELLQAQKMESLGQLTGGIAHDFNNILTAIISNVELTLQKGLDKSRQPQLMAALQAAHNGAALVRQMLAFARRQPLRAEKVDVNASVQELIALILRSAPENIKVRTSLARDLQPIKADPNQLQTCILNLVVNARDAMPRGGTLAIATAAHEQPEGGAGALAPGSYVCLSVSDTGGGMMPDVLQHAFEPFFTTKGIGKGTGLGLSTVYGTALQLGGEATIESAQGEGTTVRMYLPVWVGPDIVPDRRREVDDAVAARETAPILYVEDDALVRTATAELLEDAGLSVHLAPDAEQALAVLRDHPEIELVVTDVGLPGMNGHELVSEARRDNPRLRVLFVTGYDRTGDQWQHADDPLSDYVDKPYEPDDLVRSVWRLLGVRSPAAAEMSGPQP